MAGGNPFRKVISGQSIEIPANVWNEMLDALGWVRQQKNATRPGSSILTRHLHIIRVKNASGAHRDRFNVLGLGAPTITPATDADSFKHEFGVTGELPTEANHLGRWCVLLEPIENNGFGKAAVGGMVPVKLNIASDKAMRFADLYDSQAGYLKLLPYGSGEVVWRETGSGEKWALVRIGTLAPGTILAKSTASITKNAVPGSNNAEFYFGNTPGSETASGINFKCATKCGDVPSGKWMHVGHNGHYWYGVAKEC